MITHICIEVRTALGCANVYLQFDQSLTETEFFKINIDDVKLTLKELSTELQIRTSDYFEIEARTINNLTVEECNASFRLTISNVKFLADSMESGKSSVDALAVVPKLSINEGSTVNLHCNNCKCCLTEKQTVQRIREFPSGPIDVSEFFCHGHTNLQDALIPQPTDIFYGFHFIVINKESSLDKIKIKEGHIYCRRCLQYLGETLLGDKALKLWTDALLLSSSQRNNEFHALVESLTLRPACQLIKKIIKDSSDASEKQMRQFHYSKVLIEATFPNRRNKYLMLHVLEKNVPVLRNSRPLTSSGYNNNNIQFVDLENFKCFKLLYRFAANDCDSQDDKSNLPPLLKLWQKDLTTLCQKVSPILFTSLLQELEENSLLLPEYYRYTRDQFQLSFIFYND